MRLHELLDGLASLSANTTQDPEITEITCDITEVTPGTMFLARSAYFGDGHKLVREAYERGAVALWLSHPVENLPPLPTVIAPETPGHARIASRFYKNPTASLRVYGVTGTNGKTSTIYLLEHMLRALGERPAVLGTIEYRYENLRAAAVNTTPDALFLQRFAAKVRDLGATALCLEVSSHALALGRMDGFLCDVAGFTNLTHDHLDFHGDLVSYEASKAKLFSEVLAASVAAQKETAASVPNTEVGLRMLAAAPAQTKRLIAGENPGTLWAEENKICFRNRGLTAKYDWPLRGAHNVENLSLALAMIEGSHPGCAHQALSSLSKFGAIPGRLQEIAPSIFVDYAHTPDALTRSIAAVRALDARPLTVLVGCGGDRDRTKRPIMAAVAATAERAIFTSDNPRSENPDAILDEMLEDEKIRLKSERYTDRALAIQKAVQNAQGPVLIAGKGHETYQEIAGKRYAFDDVAHALAAVRNEPPPEQVLIGTPSRVPVPRDLWSS